MVNYLYDLEAIEANHEAFVRTGIVARAPSIDSYLQPGSTHPGKASRSRLRVVYGGRGKAGQ
jgi:malonyl-CoA decarboxylase